MWDGSKELYASTTASVYNDWMQLVVPLVALPGTSDLDCAFVVKTHGPGQLWLDDASLQMWPQGKTCKASQSSTTVLVGKQITDYTLAPPRGQQHGDTWAALAKRLVPFSAEEIDSSEPPPETNNLPIVQESLGEGLNMEFVSCNRF
jgi:hypothetical protein